MLTDEPPGPESSPSSASTPTRYDSSGVAARRPPTSAMSARSRRRYQGWTVVLPGPTSAAAGVDHGAQGRPGRARVAISVVTVTNRPGSIDITWQTLARQSFADFEWILCDELYKWRRREVAAYVSDGRLCHVPAPVVDGDLWNLNKSYNEALRQCRGELVVSLQDYTWIAADGLERFWDLFRARGPKVFVSGVGHGYAPPPMHDPWGKVSVFGAEFSPEAFVAGPLIRTGVDVRTTGDRGGHATGPRSWELNWGAAPLEALYEIGGFPEDHDRQFVSCDNLSVAYAAQSRGYEFLLDKTNECHLLDHRTLFARPGWEANHGKNGRWERWHRQWSAQGCPRFPYLSRP